MSFSISSRNEARAAAAQSADDAAAPARDVSVVGVIGAGEAAGELAEAFSGAGLEVLRIEEAGDDLSVLSRAQVVVEAAELVEPTEVDWDELDDEERTNIEPLSALGFSMTGEDDHAEFALRLTTK